MDEPKDTGEVPASECSPNDEALWGDARGDSHMPPIPRHVSDAAAAYDAELDELLIHLAAHPGERWVAYRGHERLGFGTDDLELSRDCLAKYPDGRFCVYGIDASAKYPEDTVI